VGEVELPFARVEDRPNIAGGYRGLPLGLLKGRLPQHFLGSPDSHLDCGPHHKTVLLGCGCGEAGCWPLMSRVHVGEATVRWDDFEQPHRSDGWTYGPLCFEFDRRQYEAALQEIVIPA
jgi:hypothetical protein